MLASGPYYVLNLAVGPGGFRDNYYITASKSKLVEFLCDDLSEGCSASLALFADEQITLTVVQEHKALVCVSLRSAISFTLPEVTSAYLKSPQTIVVALSEREVKIAANLPLMAKSNDDCDEEAERSELEEGFKEDLDERMSAGDIVVEVAVAEQTIPNLTPPFVWLGAPLDRIVYEYCADAEAVYWISDDLQPCRYDTDEYRG
jgi:hypothetical protein